MRNETRTDGEITSRPSSFTTVLSRLDDGPVDLHAIEPHDVGADGRGDRVDECSVGSPVDGERDGLVEDSAILTGIGLAAGDVAAAPEGKQLLGERRRLALLHDRIEVAERRPRCGAEVIGQQRQPGDAAVNVHARRPDPRHDRDRCLVDGVEKGLDVTGRHARARQLEDDHLRVRRVDGVDQEVDAALVEGAADVGDDDRTRVVLGERDRSR